MYSGPTDFFDWQSDSRRRSLIFGVVFTLIIVFGFFFMYQTVRLMFLYLLTKPEDLVYYSRAFFGLHEPALLICLLFFAITLGSTVQEIINIHNSGSTYAATALGGVPLGDSTVLLTDLGKQKEKILKNVVSEMALAASLPEPDIYIMPKESGINALAAGLSPTDAALVITKGSLVYLNREELMGLVAHEFSHIKNGDMRHNTLMAGWLHGLFTLTIIGWKIVGTKSRGSIFGLILVVSGSFTTTMGKLVQAAFNRQREYLADASSVQFTRQVRGLAGTLKKIGGLKRGSRITSRTMPAYRNFFLANPARFSWFDTHPPLEDRIFALDPKWDGYYFEFEDEDNPYSMDHYPF